MKERPCYVIERPANDGWPIEYLWDGSLQRWFEAPEDGGTEIWVEGERVFEATVYHDQQQCPVEITGHPRAHYVKCWPRNPPHRRIVASDN
jgi:hypothetical protein